MKFRTGFVAAAALAALLFAAPTTSAQTAPDVQLSRVKWQPTLHYISGARFNADKSGRMEDDYFGFPVSRPFPGEQGGSASYLPQQAYYLTAKVTNNETRTIRSAVWEITYFEDAAKTRKLGCRPVNLLGRVSPGKTRSLRQHLATKGKFEATPYSTTNLLRVDYTDDTAWESSEFKKIRSGERQRCGS